MKWIGTDQGFELVQDGSEVKKISKEELYELFPELNPVQAEATEEKPKKGK